MISQGSQSCTGGVQVANSYSKVTWNEIRQKTVVSEKIKMSVTQPRMG
jgi:hypothetical protein